MLLEIKTVCFAKLPLLNLEYIYVTCNLKINLYFRFSEKIQRNSFCFHLNIKF